MIILNFNNFITGITYYNKIYMYINEIIKPIL